jgi:hypothetical protein
MWSPHACVAFVNYLVCRSACSQNLQKKLLPHLIPSPLDPLWLSPMWSIVWLAFDQ